MCYEDLKDKANSLPLLPGVYIMRDKKNTVIYVGKAKRLRNRVSQYFQETVSHSAKTRLMVSKIDHFDVIVAASEFEALVLECSLIKRYLPKYNILLKDDKGYPYLRLDMKQPFPVITMVSRVEDDGASYYGPYGSRGVTQNLLETIQLVLKLPACSKKFPKELGKGRPCLNYHMNQCDGWCQRENSVEEYRNRIEIGRQLLMGNFKTVADDIRKQMLEAADALNFELAASMRDRLNSVEALRQKQLVTAGSLSDTDVIGFYQTDSTACFTIMHFSGGNLMDKEYEIFPAVDDIQEAISSLLKQYYLSNGFSPKLILLPFAIDDAELFSQFMQEKFDKKVRFNIPQRGEKAHLVELANKNAREEAERITTKEERVAGSLRLLGKMLSIDPPTRIESFDISNIAGSDIVASMVVFKEGKPFKSGYKRFKLEGMDWPDDYASMRQVLYRRFSHYLKADAGFEEAPDLLLIDGGITHAQTALGVLTDLELDFPVLGMVKDDRHRTRALVTPDGKEVTIETQQYVFSLIGNIQEETHRFAISYHRMLRSKRLRYSELDSIPGIGDKRKQELIKYFKSLTAIREATVIELERCLPRPVALAVYEHFHQD